MGRQTLRAFSLSRQLPWSFATGGQIDSSPTVSNGLVYVGSHDGKVYALNASTGMVGENSELHNDVVWSFTSGNMIMFSSPAVADGVVYVGSYDSNVYALNATKGAFIWSYKTGYSVVSSPAVSNGVVYVGSEDDNVYALNASTGALIWKYATGGMIMVSSPAVADGKVYIGSNDFNVYALDAANGSLVWKYPTGATWFLRQPFQTEWSM